MLFLISCNTSSSSRDFNSRTVAVSKKAPYRIFPKTQTQQADSHRCPKTKKQKTTTFANHAVILVLEHTALFNWSTAYCELRFKLKPALRLALNLTSLSSSGNISPIIRVYKFTTIYK